MNLFFQCIPNTPILGQQGKSKPLVLGSLKASDSFDRKHSVQFGEQYGKERKIWRYNEDGELQPSTSHVGEITPHDVEEYLLAPNCYGGDEVSQEDKEIIEKMTDAFTRKGLLEQLKKRFGKEIEGGQELLMANIGHADLYPALLLNGV